MGHDVTETVLKTEAVKRNSSMNQTVRTVAPGSARRAGSLTIASGRHVQLPM